ADGCAGELRRPNAATETAAHASGPDSKNAPAMLPRRCQPQGSTAIPKAIHCDSCYIADLPRCVVTGAIRIFLQRPKEEVRLTPGEPYSVPPKRPHLVTNAGDTSAVFLVLQGIGDYDFVPLADTRTGERGRQKPGR